MSPESKIDRIYEMVNSQNITLAKFLTQQEQHRKELDENAENLKELNEYKNKAVGAGAVIGLITGTIGAFIVKHF